MWPSRVVKDEISAIFSAMLLDTKLVRAPLNQPPPRHTAKRGLSTFPHSLPQKKQVGAIDAFPPLLLELKATLTLEISSLNSEALTLARRLRSEYEALQAQPSVDSTDCACWREKLLTFAAAVDGLRASQREAGAAARVLGARTTGEGLGLPLVPPAAVAGGAHVPPSPPAVFLSHKWEQKPLVERIARCLAGKGVTYWLDTEQMAAGGWLLDKISRGVDACRVVLVVLSREYLTSENCNTELQLARSYGKSLVVLKLPGVDCPPHPDAGRFAAAMAGVVAGELWLGAEERGPVPEKELLRALKEKGVPS
jgi:hypothetical protein